MFDKETVLWLIVMGISSLFLLALWLGTRKSKDQL